MVTSVFNCVSGQVVFVLVISIKTLLGCQKPNLATFKTSSSKTNTHIFTFFFDALVFMSMLIKSII